MKKPSLILTISLICGGLLISAFPLRIALFTAYILNGFNNDGGLVFGFLILIPAIFFAGIVAIIIGMIELNTYMKWRKSLKSNSIEQEVV